MRLNVSQPADSEILAALMGVALAVIPAVIIWRRK